MAEPFPKSRQLARSRLTRRGRVFAHAAEWRIFREAKLDGRACRICRVVRAQSFHHIVPRSRLGDDVLSNLVELCGDGTTGCHGLIEHRDRWARNVLASRLTPAERAYCVGKLGEGAMQRLFGV